jgi:hypothetical protein
MEVCQTALTKRQSRRVQKKSTTVKSGGAKVGFTWKPELCLPLHLKNDDDDAFILHVMRSNKYHTLSYTKGVSQKANNETTLLPS